MAAPFQVNLVLGAGVDFNQQFYLANADKSPIDITGYQFYASLSKYPRALNALESAPGAPVFDRTPFVTSIVDGTGGVYALSMPASSTVKLQEGKYVYDVVMRDLNGELQQCGSGLVFVDVAFGAPIEEVVVVKEVPPTNA